ncbi:MAG: hypothetical protein Q9217_005137 [Psora testacea]
MSPPCASAKITLSCPLYAADFDPENSGFLLVGGGGGEGRSGVGNKITLLNASKKHDLSEVVDIDLSRDEDSVTSLAYAQSTELWATAFAGINSSMKEQQQGKNEHLRSFLLEYPPRRRITSGEADTLQEKASEYEAQTKALTRVSYFTPSTASKPETFQRIMRLSRKRKANGPRLGAVATGLAPEGEVVVFAADTSSPSVQDIRGRIKLGKNEEAADVDIIGLADFSDSQDDETNFKIAYCTDYDIFMTECNYNYNRSEELDSQCIHSIPYPDVFASTKARPRFRSLRFLTPSLLLILQNMPNGAGSELCLMDVTGSILLRKRLHRKIKSGTTLTVAALPFTSTSTTARKQIQHAIAVAGADTSITIFTLNHTSRPPYTKLQFHPHLFLPSVHPTSITSLTFSTHNPPSTPWTQTPAQYLKLASTSIANTCVVHTLPLTPHSPPRKRPDTVASYVLTVPGAKSSITNTTFSVLAALLAVGIGAFFLQAFTEIRGGTPEILGAKGWLNEQWHGWLAVPYVSEDGMPTAVNRIDDAAHMPLSVASGAAETPVEALYGAMDGAGNRVSGVAENVGEAVEATGEKLGLRDVLRQRNVGSDTSDAGNDGKEIIVRHAPAEGGKMSFSAEVHEPETLVKHHTEAKKWEDMEHQERETWKRRLIDAGEWAVEEGESVLKGVFFSGLGAAVGAAVGG